MKDGWRFNTITSIVLFIHMYITGLQPLLELFLMREVLTPRIGHHPMHDNYTCEYLILQSEFSLL